MKVAKNVLDKVLIKEGIRKADLVRETKLASSTISKVANFKIDPSPVTMNRIVIGLNKIINKEKYQVGDIFPEYNIE